MLNTKPLDSWNEDPFEFGDRLQDAIDRKGWTEKRLAAEVGAGSSNIISKWKSGKIKPNYFYIKALAIALDVSAGYLLGLEEAKR